MDFDALEVKIIPHMKGGKGVAQCQMVDDGLNKIMRAVLDPGCSIGYHQHTDSSEICFILQGEASCILDGREETLKAGEVHYCPKGSYHSMENKGTLPLVSINVVPKQ